VYVLEDPELEADELTDDPLVEAVNEPEVDPVAGPEPACELPPANDPELPPEEVEVEPRVVPDEPLTDPVAAVPLDEPSWDPTGVVLEPHEAPAKGRATKAARREKTLTAVRFTGELLGIDPRGLTAGPQTSCRTGRRRPCSTPPTAQSDRLQEEREGKSDLFCGRRS
jgi:hypothetical protein